MTELLFTSIFLIIASAFCTGSEAALFSVNKIRVQLLAEQGNKQAIRLLRIKESMGNAIGTLVILTNIFGIAGALYLGGLLKTNLVVSTNPFEIFFARHYEIFYTLVTVLFAETIPKNAGEKYSLQIALFTAPIISVIAFVFKPVLWLLEKASALIIGHSKNIETASEAEVIAMTDLGLESNNIEKDEHEIIQNVFKMNDRTAKDIMTPRVQIDTLDSALTLDQQKEVIFAVEHSRLPVIGEDCDDILGFVLLREVLEEMAKGHSDLYPIDGCLLHKVVAVKEHTKVDQLLLTFQKYRVHQAIVIDDYGGTSGLVTLEDVLEQLVGEIVDETDTVVDLQKEKNEYQKDIQMIG